MNYSARLKSNSLISCHAHEYALNREPTFFKDSLFVIDKFHYRNHRACSRGYNSKLFKEAAALNSQAAKQFNSILKKIAMSVQYSDAPGFFLLVLSFMLMKIIVDALTEMGAELLPALEAEVSNIAVEKSAVDEVGMNNSNYQSVKVLPPMPSKLAKLSCKNTRLYVSRGISIITKIRDTRKLYKQDCPGWWPEKIPFVKPGVVPELFQKGFGDSASSKWHNHL